MTARRTDHGFTLLEVLVATVIAAIAMAVLFEGVSSGLRSTHAALRREGALVRAQSHLAALGHGTTLITGHRQGDDGDGYRWQLDVRPLATATQSQPGGNSSRTTLYDIRVTISWGTTSLSLDSRALGPATPGDGG